MMCPHKLLAAAAVASCLALSRAAETAKLLMVSSRPPAAGEAGAFISSLDVDTGALDVFVPYNSTLAKELGSPDDIILAPGGGSFLVSFGRLGSDGLKQGSIQEFTLAGAYVGPWAKGSPGNGLKKSDLCRPYGMAIAPNGNIYVASFGTDKILTFTPDGTFIEVFASGLKGPDTLLFVGDRLFVTEEGSTASPTCAVDFLGDPSQIVVFNDYTEAASKAVFAPQPKAFPDPNFGFVSMLGLGIFGDTLYASDFGGGIRSYDVNDGTLLSKKAITKNSFIGDLAVDPESGDVLMAGFDRDTLLSFALRFPDGALVKPEVILKKTAAVQRAIGVLLLT